METVDAPATNPERPSIFHHDALHLAAWAGEQNAVAHLELRRSFFVVALASLTLLGHRISSFHHGNVPVTRWTCALVTLSMDFASTRHTLRQRLTIARCSIVLPPRRAGSRDWWTMAFRHSFNRSSTWRRRSFPG